MTDPTPTDPRPLEHERDFEEWCRHGRMLCNRIEALEAQLAEAQAMVAAAYEAAGDRAADVYDAQDMPSGSDVAGYIRALTPVDALAALDRIRAQCRLEGMQMAAAQHGNGSTNAGRLVQAQSASYQPKGDGLA